jgi:hypothetical protein
LVTYSEQFDNAAWAKSNATITANSVVSPDGYTNADTYTATGGANYVSGGATSTGSNTITYSVFVKAGTQSTFRVREAFYFGTATIFNLSSGTITSGTGTITNYGNGWYRCTHTQAYGAGQTNVSVIFDTTASSGTFYLWGAQFEVGAYATSYIPTLAASATRGADAASKTGISSLIGQLNGWIYGEVEGLTNSYGSKSVILSVNDGSSLNRVELSFNPTTGYITARIYKAGSTIFVIDYFKNSLTTQFKFAIGYGDGRAAFYVNGTKIHEVTSLTFFTSGTLTKVSADNYNGGEAGFGRVSTYLIGTSNLTNAELAELTTL